jgi:hypothetical protein
VTEAIATALVQYFGVSAATATAWAYAIVVTATVVVGNYQQRNQRAKARDAYNANLKDRELMLRSAVAPQRVVYGRDRISGPIVYAESTGVNEEFLHLVLVLASHELDAVETIYFNEVALPALDVNGFVVTGEFAPSDLTNADSITGVVAGDGSLALGAAITTIHQIARERVGTSPPEYDYLTGWSHTTGGTVVTGLTPGDTVYVVYTGSIGANPKVRIKVHLGGAGQTADADLIAESAGKWTADHIGAGVAYLYIRLEYDQDIFGSTGLPNISAVVRGKKIYDPRSSLTAWSNNAALCVADFLQSAEGLRATSAEMPTAEVISAANICDETIDLVLGGSVTQKRYTCDTSFTTDTAPRDVLTDLLACMAGRAIWTQGRWLVRPGAYRTPTVTINEDSLASGVTVIPRASRSDLFNAVRATYRDPDQAYAEVQAPMVENAQYEDEDGGVQIPRHIQIPTLADTYRAQRLCKIELERARQALTVRLSTKLDAYDLAPTDTVYLTLAQYGWDAKPFEVMERTLNPTAVIDYSLRETVADVYAWNYGEATIGDPAPNTYLTSPYAPPGMLAGFAAEEGAYTTADGTVISTVILTWDVSTEPFVLQSGSIEVEWRSMIPDAEWQREPTLTGDATTTTVSQLKVGVAYLFRIRQVNASGQGGDWAYVNMLLVGVTGMPPNVAGLAFAIKPAQVELTWDPCLDPAYAVTELRHSGTGWDDATFLWSGSASHLLWPRPDNGTYTVRAKHKNNSGIYSATAASIAVEVTDAIDPGAGESVYVEYSVDGSTSWHSTFTSGDLYARWKIGLSGTWTDAWRIVGETGAGGDWVSFIFKRSAVQPATPTGAAPVGWFDAPPAADGNGLWNSLTLMDAGGTPKDVWSTPVRIDADAGADAETISLTATGFAFVFADSTQTTAQTPAQIDFEAVLQNVSGTVTFSAIGYDVSNGALAARTLTNVTATTCRLTAANFVGANGAALRYVVVTATIGALSDKMTVYRGDNGANAVQCVLSNEAHTLQADNAGTVGSYSGSGTTIRVYEGTAELTYDGSGATAGTWALSHSATNITRGTLTDSGAYATIGDANSMSADSATITYTITGKSQAGNAFSIVKVQSFAKSRAGVTGSTGPTGPTGGTGPTGNTGQSTHRVYKAATIGSPPSTPGNTTSGATPSGWSATPVSLTTGQEQYQSDGTTPAGSTTTTWATPYPSYLKVGSLSAISADMGTLTAGSISTSGYVKAEGNIGVSLPDPASLSGASRTVALAGNVSGGQQVGALGYSATGGYPGVYGYNSNSASNGIGVFGYGKPGVLGKPISGTAGAGVQGEASSTSGSAGVLGFTGGASTYGVRGSTGFSSAGVAVHADGSSGGTALQVVGTSTFSGQLASTLSTGTAPFSIASTTRVDNLNADTVDGQHASAFQTALGFAPVQQGTGTSQTGNAVKIGWSAASALRLQIDSTDYGTTWPINIGGQAASISGNVTTGSATATYNGVNKPGSSTSNTWAQITINGTSYYVPVWT